MFNPKIHLYLVSCNMLHSPLEILATTQRCCPVGAPGLGLGNSASLGMSRASFKSACSGEKLSAFSLRWEPRGRQGAGEAVALAEKTLYRLRSVHIPRLGMISEAACEGHALAQRIL